MFVLPILVNEKDVYTLFYRFKTTISEILSNYATIPRPRVRTAAPSLVDRLSTNTRHDTTRPRRDRRTTTSRPPARRTSDRPSTAAAGPARAVADVATTVSYSIRASPASRTTDHRYSSHIGPPLSHCGWDSVGRSLSAAGLVNWVWVHQKSKLLYCDRYFIGLTIVLTLNIVHCGSKIRHSVRLSL